MKKYEWSSEEMDSEGDIIDLDFADTLEQLQPDQSKDLCLVLNIGNEKQGLQERYWAYVIDGKLPDFFSDSGELTLIAVPQKFHNELFSYNKNK